MYLGLVGGVLDLVAARKLKRVSQQILDSSIAAALDPDVSNILRLFAAPLGDSVEATNAFWIYVRDPKNSKLFSEEFKLWWEQSDHWTDALRVKFVEDFGSEVAQLKGLKTTAMMDGWRKLANRDIPLSNNIKFLEDPAVVDRLVGLYDDAHLRQVYQALMSAQTQPQSLTAFLKTFDDLGAAYYTKFADDASLVKSWFRYYDEPVLNSAFLQLKKDGMLKFVERYGKCSDEGFQMIKSNAKVHIDRLLEYPDATHHVEYFNNRRAEMLPPGFEDIAKKDLYGIQEIDSFIELELILETRMRPSLKHEAGDVIALIGSLKGTSYDPMGVPYNIGELFRSGKQSYSKWLGRIGNEQIKGKGFLGSLQTHIGKIDFPVQGKPQLNKVVIDYKYFNDISTEIGQNQDYFKNYIDNFLSVNYPEYIDKIIKLNY